MDSYRASAYGQLAMYRDIIHLYPLSLGITAGTQQRPGIGSAGPFVFGSYAERPAISKRGRRMYGIA